MTTQDVANRYMQLQKQGKWMEIQTELYSHDVISLEPEHAVNIGLPVVTKGLDAVITKGKNWSESIEQMHSGYCTEPLVAGNYFTVAMGFDATFKTAGRIKTDEIALFEVKDGKIIKEQFFF
jgi:hypothetical protein